MIQRKEASLNLRFKRTPEAASLYAYITNFSMLSPDRVGTLVLCGGRERHRIEDTFNTQKNNGIGLDALGRGIIQDRGRRTAAVARFSRSAPPDVWQLFGNRSYDCPELQTVAQNPRWSREWT